MSVGFDCDGMEEVRGSNPLSSINVRLMGLVSGLIALLNPLPKSSSL